MDLITESGRKAFGELVVKSRKALDLGQQDLVDYVEDVTGYNIGRGVLQRIEHGYWQNSVKLGAFMALQKIQLLKFEDGTPLSFDDMVAVLQGDLTIEVKTPERKQLALR